MAEALSKRGREVHVVTYHLGDHLKSAPFRIYRIPTVKTYRHYAPGSTYQTLLVLDPQKVLNYMHPETHRFF